MQIRAELKQYFFGKGRFIIHFPFDSALGKAGDISINRFTLNRLLKQKNPQIREAVCNTILAKYVRRAENNFLFPSYGFKVYDVLPEDAKNILRKRFPNLEAQEVERIGDKYHEYVSMLEEIFRGGEKYSTLDKMRDSLWKLYEAAGLEPHEGIGQRIRWKLEAVWQREKKEEIEEIGRAYCEEKKCERIRQEQERNRKDPNWRIEARVLSLLQEREIIFREIRRTKESMKEGAMFGGRNRLRQLNESLQKIDEAIGEIEVILCRKYI